MDADDIALPNRFEVQYKYLDANPDFGICGSWYEFFGRLNYVEERATKFEDVQYQLFFGCPLTHPSVMMRSDLIKKYNLRYRKEYYYAEDHYFFYEGSRHFKITNIPEVLLKYRIHQSQIGSAKWKEQFVAKSKIQAKIFSDILLEEKGLDLKWLEVFFMEKCVPDEQWLRDINYYKKRIMADNEIRQMYAQALLHKAVSNLFDLKKERNLYTYYFDKYYNQKTYSFSLLLLFLKEQNKPHKLLGKKLTAYFIIKCLTGYRKRTILSQ